MMQRLYCGYWHKAISRCPIHNSIGGFREHCRSRSSLPSIASRSCPSQAAPVHRKPLPSIASSQTKQKPIMSNAEA
jgi:hypothetical protein